MAENMAFVTIELSRKQVDTEHLVHNDKTEKDYARVFAPNGGTFLYPLESIKVDSANPDKVHFSRPVGTEIQVQYSTRIEGVPDDAPNSEKYENTTKTWKIEDLKEAYEESRREYAENNGFVNIEVPTSWGRHFTTNASEPFVSISVPIPEGDKKVYFSFVIPEERFKESTKNEGMSYFGFPKKKKDSDADYEINLKASVKNEAGEYEDVFKTVSSKELKTYIDDAVAKEAVKDLFVSTLISSKLTREFSSKEGKALVDVSVPIYEDGADRASFYSIVVPAERVIATNDQAQVRLSLFKNGPDGNPYTHTAKKSVSNGNDGYDTVSITLTSEEVIQKFAESRERYLSEANSSDHSLADELNQGGQNQNVNSFRHHGR